jgi:hypothetical protein
MSEYYSPIIKKRNFDPYPVRGKIPHFADSLNNPDCVNTPLYLEWWEQQFDRLLNGYTTGGIWIPGPYYYWLNFQFLEGLYGSIRPDFVDTQYRFFLLMDEAEKDPNCSGILVPKARRKGVSLMVISRANHGMRFIDDYRMGVVSGLDTWVTGFRNKLYKNFNNVPPELMVNWLRKNDDEFHIGYPEIINGQKREVLNALLNFKTLHDQAEKLEGEYFHHIVMEETGHFEKALEAHDSLKPGLMIGDKVIGVFFIYGTGGNMLKGSKAFKTFYNYRDSYQLKYFFIHGANYYYPYYRGAVDAKGNACHDTPNLDKDFKGYRKEQLIGCEDFKYADEKIVEGIALRAKNPDKKQLIKWKQSYPRCLDDVFNSSGSNHFDNDKLYQNLFDIDSKQNLTYGEYCLDWVKDKNGDIKIPFEVKPRPARSSDKDWQIVKIASHPTGYKDLDIVGVDGYNEDNTLTSSSLGAVVVIRNHKDIPDEDGKIGLIPVLLYYKRPPRKELFWEMSLKISVYYKAFKNTMISAESDMVIQYYKDTGAKKYLSPRPKSFDSPDSKMLNDYGVKMTVYSKPRMMSILQSYVDDFIYLNAFKEITYDLISYDEENIGTDWDSADALAYAIIRIIDSRRRPKIDENRRKEAEHMSIYGKAENKSDEYEKEENKKDIELIKEELKSHLESF